MERIRLVGAFALGVGTTLAYFWMNGAVNLGGEFVANVAGAAVGGCISIGLAMAMFAHERKVAALDAQRLAHEQRAESIRQALRHVRAIRECVQNGGAITINTGEQIGKAISESCRLAREALEDKNLTDFPLRKAMASASTIGDDAGARLQACLRDSKLTDANAVPSEADQICRSATGKLNDLIREYSELRRTPSI